MGKKDKQKQSADESVEVTTSTAPAEKAGKKKDKGEKGGGSESQFAEPGSGGQFVAKEHVGHLLIITPKAIEKDVKTVNGESDAIRADVVVVDEKDPSKSDAIDDTLIFQKVLQGQLRSEIGKRRVLGRLFLDEVTKKPGQSAPYKLAAPTKDEVKLAGEYLDSIDPLR
jgi:hypothetical protein